MNNTSKYFRTDKNKRDDRNKICLKEIKKTNPLGVPVPSDMPSNAPEIRMISQFDDCEVVDFQRDVPVA